MATKAGKSGNEPRRRSAGDWLAILLVIANISWGAYYYQFESLPAPVSTEQAGKAGFSEESAMVHAKSLAALGPRPVGSDAIELATQYVFRAAQKVRRTAPGDAKVEIDYFHAKPGANAMFKGKTQIYSNLKHVLLRLSPKNKSSLANSKDPFKNAILVNTHFDSDSVDSSDVSNTAVIMEVAQKLSQTAASFSSSVLFLFNTGGENGLNGAHSFVTQHRWSKEVIRIAVDFEAMGLGGKSSIFRSQASPFMMSMFSKTAKSPSGSVAMQDAFSAGIFKSDSDFNVYTEVGGLSGVEFGYWENAAVYHTKNDNFSNLKPGSLQHLGDNMLGFLIEGASSSDLPKLFKARGDEQQPVYFDILGMYMVVYSEKSASSINNSVIIGALVILIISLLLGGFHAIVSLVLSILSVVFMWIGSLVFSALVIVLLPFCSTSTVPFAAKPWLVLGLFGAPALLGAFLGQHLGFFLLQKYLSIVSSERALPKSYPIISSHDLIKWEAERWLFKSGFLQWFIVLVAGNYFKVGSAYLALFWLVSPALAYGLLPGIGRTPKQLKTGTLLSGMLVPVLVSAGPIIKLCGILIGSLLKSDKFPSSSPLLSANTVVAGLTSAVVCLMLVYLISIAHTTDNKSTIVLALVGVFVLSLAAVGGGVFPPYSEDAPRPINVVHIVEAKSDRLGRIDQIGGLDSYVTLFSNTPGDLGKEIASLEGEGFVCGNEKTLDLVSLTVKYSCHSSSNVGLGWKESEVPSFTIENDLNNEEDDERITKVEIDTKISTRWTLAINTNEVEDFKIEIDGESETTFLVPFGNKTNVDGWHTVNFAGGKGAPTKFSLTLLRPKKSGEEIIKEEREVLLKLRTDVNRVTAKVDSVLNKLPSWCSLYGRSTLPHTLAYLNVLPL